MAVVTARYGVNVPFWDEWVMVPLLQKAANGTLSLADLWLQHNIHRPLFPYVVMLGLADITRWDVRAELWLDVVLCIATFALLWRLSGLSGLPRRARPWAALAASAFLFSAVQAQNWLSSFQLLEYLMLPAVVGALLALVCWPGSPLAFAAAVGCAVVASFSFGAGIAVWLVGVIALMVLWRQNRYAYLAAWLACAALTLGLYFYHLDRGDGDPAYALAHPAHVVAYVLAYIGSWTRGAAYPAMILAAPGVDWLHVASGLKAPLMLPLVDALPGPVRSLLVGIPILAGMAGLLAAGLLHIPLIRDWQTWGRRWLPSLLLIYFVVIAAAMTSVQRLDLGVRQALANHYTTISALFWIGLIVPGVEWVIAARAGWKPERLAWARKTAIVSALVAIVVYAASYVGGVVDIRQRSNAISRAGSAVLDPVTAPESSLQVLYPDTGFVRQAAITLRGLHESLYSALPG